MKRKTLRPVALALNIGLMLSGAAVAHETSKGPNGGSLIEVEGHHVEFVPSANELTFYLTDEKEAPLSSAGAKMKAIVQNSGSTVQLELSPVAANKLTARLDKALSPGAKVVVMGKLADGHAIQGRFVMP